MEYAIYAFGLYFLAVITWIFYLAVMSLIPHRHDLKPIAKAHAYVLVGVGLVFDIAVNVLVGSILFLEPPNIKRLLLTARLSYHTKNEHGWRTSLATWICSSLLDQFDPKGHHCDRR